MSVWPNTLRIVRHTSGKHGVGSHTDRCTDWNIPTSPEYPVVNVGSMSKPSYLPVEVCDIVPGQFSQAKLDLNQTTAMINFAVREPWVNARSIDQVSPETLGLVPQANSDLVRLALAQNLSSADLGRPDLAFPSIQG